MRSILSLFVVAALGFVVILKKDAGEAATANTQTAELAKVTQRNWKKRAPDTSHSIAKNATRQRQENELP